VFLRAVNTSSNLLANQNDDFYLASTFALRPRISLLLSRWYSCIHRKQIQQTHHSSYYDSLSGPGHSTSHPGHIYTSDRIGDDFDCEHYDHYHHPHHPQQQEEVYTPTYSRYDSTHTESHFSHQAQLKQDSNTVIRVESLTQERSKRQASSPTLNSRHLSSFSDYRRQTTTEVDQIYEESTHTGSHSNDEYTYSEDSDYSVKRSTYRYRSRLTPAAASFIGDTYSFGEYAVPGKRSRRASTRTTSSVQTTRWTGSQARRRVHIQDCIASDEDCHSVGHYQRGGLVATHPRFSNTYDSGEDSEFESDYESEAESVFSYISHASTFNGDEGAITIPAPYRFRCDCQQRELADRIDHAYDFLSDFDSLDEYEDVFDATEGVERRRRRPSQFGYPLSLFENLRTYLNLKHSRRRYRDRAVPMTHTGGETPGVLEAGMTRRSGNRGRRRSRARRIMRKIRHIVKHTEWFRTLTAAVYLFLVALAMTILQQASDTRWVNHRSGQEGLYDAGFELLGRISEEWLPDFFVLSLLGMTVIGVLWFCPTWAARQIVMRRLFWLTGSLYLYRAVTISVTTLPPPRKCEPVMLASTTPVLDVFWTGIRMFTGDIKACTDNIFSGHTMILVSCALHWRIYVRRKYIAYYVYVHMLVGIYTIVATNMHYTVDVILAMFITYGMYAIYFCVIRLAMERHRWAVEEHRTSGGKLWEKDDQEYQRVAYTPRMLNSGMIRMIVWMDGLDLRWRPDKQSMPRSTRRRHSRRSEVIDSAHPDTSYTSPDGANTVDATPEPNDTVSDSRSSLGGKGILDRTTGQQHIYPDSTPVDPVLGANLKHPMEDSSDSEDECTVNQDTTTQTQQETAKRDNTKP
jgi:hypothetical protein